MGSWVRSYNSILDDPAIAATPDDALRTWFLIQAVAGRVDGNLPGSCSQLPDLKELAWLLRMSGKESKLAKHLDMLLKVGLLERVGDVGLLPRQWSLLQKASDNPTQRKQEQRERERLEKEQRERHEAEKHSRNAQCHVTDVRSGHEMSRDNVVSGHDPPTETVTVSLSRGESEIEIERSSSSVGTKPRARERNHDDDDLLRKLTVAAKGNIVPSCRNVAPIRKLLAEGVPLEAIVASFSGNVAHLRQPLQTFGAAFIAIEAAAHAAAMASTAARGEDTARALKLAFVALDAPHWPLVEDRYRRERGGKKPPGNATGPDGDKSRPGWWFDASWPECQAAAPREAAE